MTSLRLMARMWLKRNQRLFSFSRRLYRLTCSLLHGQIRLIVLEWARAPKDQIDTARRSPQCFSAFQDLVAFTGLTEEEITNRLLRQPPYHHDSEFRWFAPRSTSELAWFYRHSSAFLFETAIHPYWEKLDFLSPDVGRVLDYGGGAGNNTVGLSKRGFAVDYMDISMVQESFVRFRAKRHSLDRIRFVDPYSMGKLDPVGCIKEVYGAIILKDVLEHIPDYERLLSHLIAHLKPHGYILEFSPFDHGATGLGVHLAPSIPLEAAMIGMTNIRPGIWQKSAQN